MRVIRLLGLLVSLLTFRSFHPDVTTCKTDLSSGTFKVSNGTPLESDAKDSPTNDIPSGDDSLLTKLGQWYGGEFRDAELRYPYLYVCQGSLFQVYGVADSAEPSLLWEAPLDGPAVTVRLWNQRAYVHDSRNLYIYGLADPTSPVLLGRCLASVTPRLGMLAIDEDSLIFAAGILDGAIRCLDVSNPQAPWIRSVVGTSFESVDISVRRRRVYAGDVVRPYAQIIDATNPDQPLVRPASNILGWFNESSVSDTLLLAGIDWFDGSSGVSAFSVADPDTLVLLGRELTRNPGGQVVAGIAVRDSLAYVATYDSGLYCLTIADPMHPTFMWRIPHWLPAHIPLWSVQHESGFLNLTEARGSELYRIVSADSLTAYTSVRAPGRVLALAARDSLVAVATGIGGVVALDFSVPAVPVIRWQVPTDAYIRDVELGDSVVYALVGNKALGDTAVHESAHGIEILTREAAVRDRVPIPAPWLMTLGGSILAVALEQRTGRDTVALLYDVSLPSALSLRSIVRGSFRVGSMWMTDSLLLIASSDTGFVLVSLYDDGGPVQRARMFDGCSGVVAAGDTAYVVGGTIVWPFMEESLYVVDVAVPDDPRILHRSSWPGSPGVKELRVQGSSLLWAGADRGMYDIADPRNPRLVDCCTEVGSPALATAQTLVYVAERPAGVGAYRNDLVTSVPAMDPRLPSVGEVHVNVYPNPVNGPVTIAINSADNPTLATIEVVDILGRVVEVLWDGPVHRGMTTLIWNAEGHASGVYFCRLRSPEGGGTVKILLLR